MTAWDLADLLQCVDAVPKPFPMKLSTGTVIQTREEFQRGGCWLDKQERAEVPQLVWDGTCAEWRTLEAAGVAVMNEVTAELDKGHRVSEKARDTHQTQ